MLRHLMYCHRHRYRSMWIAFAAALLAVLISYIPLRLTFAYWQHPDPDAILMLGGGRNREVFTAQFAAQTPELDIWISTGLAPSESQVIFNAAHISQDRLYLDRRAIDTVTNFTSLVEDFKAMGRHHLYLITSDFHMRRAMTIAFFVLGSQGIAYTPVAVPSDVQEETIWHVARDAGRSLLWLTTGRTGASLHPKLRASRVSFLQNVLP